MSSSRYSFQIFMKLIFTKYFEKYTNIKFQGNPPSGRRVVPCRRKDGQTDMTKLIVVLRNFAICSVPK